MIALLILAILLALLLMALLGLAIVFILGRTENRGAKVQQSGYWRRGRWVRSHTKHLR